MRFLLILSFLVTSSCATVTGGIEGGAVGGLIAYTVASDDGQEKERKGWTIVGLASGLAIGSLIGYFIDTAKPKPTKKPCTAVY